IEKIITRNNVRPWLYVESNSTIAAASFTPLPACVGEGTGVRGTEAFMPPLRPSDMKCRQRLRGSIIFSSAYRGRLSPNRPQCWILCLPLRHRNLNLGHIATRISIRLIIQVHLPRWTDDGIAIRLNPLEHR